MRQITIADIIGSFVGSTGVYCLVIAVPRNADLSRATTLRAAIEEGFPGGYDHLCAWGLLVIESDRLDGATVADLKEIGDVIGRGARTDGVDIAIGLASQFPQLSDMDMFRDADFWSLPKSGTSGTISSPAPTMLQKESVQIVLPTPPLDAVLLRVLPTFTITRAQAVCGRLGIPADCTSLPRSPHDNHVMTSEACVLIMRAEGHLRLSPEGLLGQRMDRLEAVLQERGL